MRTVTRYLLAFLVVAACGGSDSTAPNGSTSGTTGTGGTGSTGGTTGGTTTTAPTLTADVTVSDFAFTPRTVTILKGGTVTWTWNTPTTHNITFTDGSGSGDQSMNATFNQTFATAGVYTYQCTIHSGMGGSVVVQ